MNDLQRARRILGRVNERTQRREVQWEIDPDAEAAYRTRIGAGWARILSEDEDGVAPYRFVLVGSNDAEAVSLRSLQSEAQTAKELNLELVELYRTVRSQVLGIDEVLRDFESELGLG
jgi:hypothetical protein